MTLIRISEHQGTGISYYKNAWWEAANQTPNEAFRDDERYKRVAQNFYKRFKESTGLKKPFRWVEVRLISKPSLIYTGQRDWYEDPLFADRIFWVWQTPVFQVIDGMAYTYHVLEPLECQRVHDIRFAKRNYRVGGPTACVIPTECCDMAWHETANGYSEHLRHRPDPTPTPVEQEKAAIRHEAAEKLLAKSMDISSSPKWQRAMDLAAKRMGLKISDG